MTKFNDVIHGFSKIRINTINIINTINFIYVNI